jgi:hypothetical protein
MKKLDLVFSAAYQAYEDLTCKFCPLFSAWQVIRSEIDYFYI